MLTARAVTDALLLAGERRATALGASGALAKAPPPRSYERFSVRNGGSPVEIGSALVEKWLSWGFLDCFVERHVAEAVACAHSKAVRLEQQLVTVSQSSI